MFCKNCGKELKEGAKFCTGCGTAVTFPKSLDEADRPVTPKPYEQDIPESVPSPHIYENTAQVNAPHEAKKPKYKAAVIALCIAGGMVLAIAIPIVYALDSIDFFVRQSLENNRQLQRRQS